MFLNEFEAPIIFMHAWHEIDSTCETKTANIIIYLITNRNCLSVLSLVSL